MNFRNFRDHLEAPLGFVPVENNGGDSSRKKTLGGAFPQPWIENGKAKDWYICGSSAFPVRYKLSRLSGLAVLFFPFGLIMVELLIIKWYNSTRQIEDKQAVWR